MNATDDHADLPEPPSRPSLPDHAHRRGELLALIEDEAPQSGSSRRWLVPLGAVAALAAVAVAAAVLIPAVTSSTVEAASEPPTLPTIVQQPLVRLSNDQTISVLDKCFTYDLHHPTGDPMDGLIANHLSDIHPGIGFRVAASGAFQYLATAVDQAAHTTMVCTIYRDPNTVDVLTHLNGMQTLIAPLGFGYGKGQTITVTEVGLIYVMPAGTARVEWIDPANGVAYPVEVHDGIAFLDLVDTPAYLGSAVAYLCPDTVILHAYDAKGRLIKPSSSEAGYMSFNLAAPVPAGQPHHGCETVGPH